MEKEENLNQENAKAKTSNEENEADKQPDDKQEEIKEVEEKVELSPEEKIKHLLKWKTREEGLKKKKMMHLIMEALHLQKRL
ncbi:hypothetical protein N9W20_03430 [Candidatus Pelagibacter bacterium]|nr:hypothetical protein [Candidatus Pelagibacter bacterium]